MLRKFLTLAGIFCVFQVSIAQQKQDALDYIARYKDLAIAEMLRCHIPASITLAQGIHESGCGKSPLCVQANNHFGIKCTNVWEGKTYYQNDDAPNECFRVYDRPEDSYVDHSDFLGTRPRYSFLFQLPVNDYTAWAYGLKVAGYATNPKYPQILLNTISLYNLQQYDSIGLGMMGAPVPAPAYTRASSLPVLQAGKQEPLKAPKLEPKGKEIPTEIISGDANKREEFIINGVRALKAVGNEDPLAIAFAYNIDYDHIVAFNDLAEGEHFKDGEFIYLQSKKPHGTQATYMTRQGESMRDISQKFGIKVRELYFKNGMQQNDQPYLGETVYLQEKRSSAPRTMTYVEFLKSVSCATPTPHGSPLGSARGDISNSNTAALDKNIEQANSYKVERSDTLYSIARKFNLSVARLKAMNNLQGSELRPGQTLVIGK